MANHFTLEYDEDSSQLSSGIDQTPPIAQKKPLFSLPPSFNPSSTPAGPPPSQKPLFSERPAHFSTTPAGPPPSSIYGSSALGGGRKLQFKPPADPPSTKNAQPKQKARLPPRTANGTPARPRAKAGLAFSSGSATSRAMFTHTAPSQENQDSIMSAGDEDEDVLQAPVFNISSRFDHVDASTRSQQPPFKSSMGGHSYSRSRHQPQGKAFIPRPSQLPRRGNEAIIPGIAQVLASQSSVASLEEPEDLIIRSEEAMQELANRNRRREDTPEKTTEIIADLIMFWRRFVYPDNPSISNARIGPPDQSSGLEKANYIASLLLLLHHRPFVAEPLSKKDNSKTLAPDRKRPAPVPLILLDWLDNYHVSYERQLDAVLEATPNCTSHEYFWDIIQSLVMRAKLAEVIHLLREADFQYAVTAKDDGYADAGYHGSQLQAVHSAINRARKLLGGCPSLERHWNTSDDDWDLYRKRVSIELDHLADLVEDDVEAEDDDEDEFRADNFGIRRQGGNLMKSIRKPANRLPLSIYHSLKTLYSILLGSVEDIMDQSQDWLEAATSLTIWWDGSEQDDITNWSKNVTHSNMVVDGYTDEHYLARLRTAFLCVTDPEHQKSLQINTMSSAEVGLGAVLQGDHTSVLRILRTLSLPIASVVAETGSRAGWMSIASRGRESQLDQEDLMVLSYAAPSGVSKDDILSEYAEALFDKTELRSADCIVVEGWELALSIASRFDSSTQLRSTTSDFLDRLDLNSEARMDKLVGLCSALGLEEEAQKVCEKFADHLVHNTSDYGTALLCYARSHASNKLRQLVDLLVSYCLVQSKAYPSEDEMDDSLRALVTSPKAALSGLLDVDPEATDMLQFYLVGYACIRKFYNLRDEEVTAAKNKSKLANRPIARRRLAAKALMAAINSAADSIYGGLYDAERQSAIQVDGLLPLLGETTAFLADANNKPVLTTTQLYALLAAIEDLQSVNVRVYNATEECLQAALRQYHGSQPPSPHAMLKKSMSSGTNSNFSFSMMGSEMLARSGTSAGGKSDGSAVLIGRDDAERGWDWRARFKDKNSTGADILRGLRLGIAKELSVAELDGE